MVTLERRDALKLGGAVLGGAALAALAIDVCFHPVLKYLGIRIKNPDLDPRTASIDQESSRMLAEMRSIDPYAQNLSTPEKEAVFFLMGRYLTIYDAQRSGRLSLDMNYVVLKIDPETQNVTDSQVGEAIAFVNPFSGVLEATVNWGNPGGYYRVLSQIKVDIVDGVDIIAHELLGHTHYDLVRLLELFQRGVFSLEMARALNKENPQRSEEEIESWCVGTLMAYLYQKTHPEHQYRGFYHNPQEVSTDDLGFVNFWIGGKSTFPSHPWQDREMRWFLERDAALITLRKAAVFGDFSQPLFLPLTVRDSDLDGGFLETARSFFTVDGLARNYGVDMDPSESNPWIKLHLNDISFDYFPDCRKLLQTQTRREYIFHQKMIGVNLS